MTVKLKDRKEIAKGFLELTFDTLGQDLGFQAGQFFVLTLKNIPDLDERGDHRFLGFSSSPSHKDFFTTTTRMGVSSFKKYLASMPIGTEAEVSGIDGKINHLPEDKNTPLVFIAGGIGISPVIGLLRFLQEQSWPYSVTLIHVNETRDSAAYFEEIEMMAKDNPRFKFVPVITNDPSWSGEKRSVDSAFIKEYFPEVSKFIFAITGAPSFVPATFRQIQQAGAPVTNLKMEIFTGY